MFVNLTGVVVWLDGCGTRVGRTPRELLRGDRSNLNLRPRIRPYVFPPIFLSERFTGVGQITDLHLMISRYFSEDLRGLYHSSCDRVGIARFALILR